MNLLGDPGPWQDYLKRHLGKPIDQIKQQYLAEQLTYFRAQEEMINMIAYQGASQAQSIITPPALQPFRLLFVDIAAVETIIGDPTDVSNWNTYFDLPTLGEAFTSVSITGNEVKLYGGSNIKIKPAIMYDQSEFIIELDDQTGCITSVGGDAFTYSTSLTTVNLPACTIVYGYDDSPENDYGGFGECVSLVSLSMPALITAGTFAFNNTAIVNLNLPSLMSIADSSTFGNIAPLQTLSLASIVSICNSAFSDCSLLNSISLPSCVNLGTTVGDDSIFSSTVGNTITLTIPSALMTCNSGNPDGDIQYLQANNAVTVVTV